MIIYSIRRLRRSVLVKRAVASARARLAEIWSPGSIWSSGIETASKPAVELSPTVAAADQWQRISTVVQSGFAKSKRVEECQTGAMAHLDGATYALQSLVADLSGLLGQAEMPARPVLANADFRAVPFRRREQIAA